MWLLHSLLILFLIHQLIIITHAHLAIRRPHLWLPDHPTEDLLPEAKSYWEQQHPAKSSTSRSTSRPPWFFNGFKSRQKSPSVPDQTQAPLEIDPHQLTISYFRNRLQPKTLSTEEKRKLIGKTLRYILDRPSMPTEQRLEWYEEILNKFDNYAVMGALATIDHILYAFHTLLLQSKDEHLSRMTKFYLEQFKVKIGQTGIPLAGQWSQEIHYPEKRLSEKFLDWDSLFTVLRYHPELEQMVLAKNNNLVDFITKNLEQLYQIQLFSASPKQFISAQTRVASIALLHHLLDMKRFPKIIDPVQAVIKSLINDKENKYFLFEHERTLIGNLDREQSAKPTKATTSS